MSAARARFANRSSSHPGEFSNEISIFTRICRVQNVF
jgi:hypothetical protein